MGPWHRNTKRWQPALMDWTRSPELSMKDSIPQTTPMNPARLDSPPYLENMGLPALESTKKCLSMACHSGSEVGSGLEDRPASCGAAAAFPSREGWPVLGGASLSEGGGSLPLPLASAAAPSPAIAWLSGAEIPCHCCATNGLSVSGSSAGSFSHGLRGASSASKNSSSSSSSPSSSDPLKSFPEPRASLPSSASDGSSGMRPATLSPTKSSSRCSAGTKSPSGTAGSLSEPLAPALSSPSEDAEPACGPSSSPKSLGAPLPLPANPSLLQNVSAPGASSAEPCEPSG
mmetsp:Transcript_21040/g.50222  ORF Transcript_21040/g.50222 Transcript_21040/m.50222 type:complete len:288 (-) Transcript_21040:1027-1890(-)